jgi:hypothetical protein
MLTSLLLTFLSGSTWYVDVDAVAPGDGSLATPYTSIHYALDQATTVDGDTVVVAPGTYVENVLFPKRVKVDASAGPTETVLRAATPGIAVSSMISEDFPPGGPFLVARLRGFTVDGTGNESGIGAETKVGADFSMLVLERCIVRGFTAGQGVRTHANGYIDIVQCTVTQNQSGLDAPVGVSWGDLGVRGCIVSGNTVDVVAPNTLSYHPTSSCVPASIASNGPNNFSGAPGLWNAAAGDFHLAPLSPCIDKATGISLPLDPDGSQPDIGALTYDPNYAPTPTTYCTPKTTSKGCAPLVTWTGSASLTGPDDFFLTASPALNKKVGKFVWGTAPKALPFAGGSLCVKLPFVRGPHLDSGGSATGSDCTGVFTWHFSQAYMASKGVTAGAILYAQAWGRDQGFAPPNPSQLSDAIVFQVAP